MTRALRPSPSPSPDRSRSARSSGPRRGALPDALPGALAGALLLLAAACGGSPPPRAVIVLIDTLRRDALGCYGADQDPTPVLDALAEQGVRFEQAISTSGWTLPSVASLMTSTWPSVHKAMGKVSRLTPISEDVQTAAEAFSEAGFATLAVANAAFLSPLLGLDRGFDVFDHRHAFNAKIRRARPSVERALELVAERPSDPFLLVVHLFDPHLDYDPPPDLAERFTGGRNEPALPLSALDCTRGFGDPDERPGLEDLAYIRGAYQAEVAYVDREVGRLLDGLRELGMYDETWIVVTADHGEEFWDHDGFEHGHTLYDELVRVPMIVKPPASTARPLSVVDSQVRVLDVMPTLLDAFGIDPPETFAGTSLLPVIAGEDRGDRVVLLESTLYGSDRVALRGGRYKYVRDRQPGARVEEEIYDWRTDPFESKNLVNQRSDVAEEMRAALRDFRASIASEVARTRPGEMKDISPATRDEVEEALRSLGYTGRDDD